MKTILLLTSAMLVANCQAQMTAGLVPPPAAHVNTPLENQQAILKMEQPYFTPANPWRAFGKDVYYAKGPDWVQFVGKVIEVHAGKGIRVDGWYGPPMTWPDGPTESLDVNGSFLPKRVEFFVANFPYDVVPDDYIIWSQKLVARQDSTYSYSTVNGSSRTLRKLDFGIVTSEPQAAPLTDAQKEANARAKADREQKEITRYTKMANDGDAYAEYKLGIRYLKGDGVTADKIKAFDLLNKSASQGCVEAKATLAEATAKK